MYPWRGEFTVGDPSSPVSIVTLSTKIDFPKEKVAIWGYMKTENLGIEKVIANVVSNPNIRVLILCGEEVRGHRSGHSLISLHNNGLDGNGRIIDAKGAVPFIENLSSEAIERFKDQVEIVDMIGEKQVQNIIEEVDRQIARGHRSYGEPFIVEIMKETPRTKMTSLVDKVAIHKDLLLDPYLEVEDMPAEVT